MLLLLRSKPQLVDIFQRIPQAVTALKSVLDLAENLPDLTFDRIWTASA
jgi:hypothetical protein